MAFLFEKRSYTGYSKEVYLTCNKPFFRMCNGPFRLSGAINQSMFNEYRVKTLLIANCWKFIW